MPESHPSPCFSSLSNLTSLFAHKSRLTSLLLPARNSTPRRVHRASRASQVPGAQEVQHEAKGAAMARQTGTEAPRQKHMAAPGRAKDLNSSTSSPRNLDPGFGFSPALVSDRSKMCMDRSGVSPGWSLDGGDPLLRLLSCSSLMRGQLLQSQASATGRDKTKETPSRARSCAGS